ncbi:MAG: aspartate-semialdehyde dehydrogenase [Alphaproteobacteria bacterium]|nr:aspartate-semialdehyde dehydrogenase [Alphaproteobacteria bacterium]TAD88342.1 MAG: aspartate-semialdehyde dehydrogenase [Alphaproteobacteria bacterium]
MHVGIVGATGAVGAELISVLARRRFPVTRLDLFASERSAGKTVTTPFGEKTLTEFSVEAAGRCDVVFLAVSGSFAEQYAPELAKTTLVIDNSSAFRYRPEVPLVVPEINADAIGQASLIANPNCTTAVLVVALAPIARAFGLERVIVSSYQATSGAGKEGMEELTRETARVLAGETASRQVFAHPIAFNLIPHIDVFQPNGYTKEEMKVTWESRKIMGLPDLKISCTAVRVPTLRVHSEAVTIETKDVATPDAVRAVLTTAPGVDVVDDPANNRYPMPIGATGKDNVEVGRIRRNEVFGDRGIDLFLCGDQLLKGAALNAVQIAEAAMAQGRLPAGKAAA